MTIDLPSQPGTYCLVSSKLECIWAELLLEDEQSDIPINKFGSSDCDCLAHLFYYQVKPELNLLIPDDIKVLSTGTVESQN